MLWLLRSLSLLLLLAFQPALASIAVLNFELNDLTLAPANPAELQRVQSAQPLLQTALQAQGQRLVTISDEQQQQANQGFGYLFEHPDVVAALGRAHQTDYVIVGRLHKPSFLFAYFMLKLVDSHNGKVLADLVIEAKGSDSATTQRSLTSAAHQLIAALPQPTVAALPPAPKIGAVTDTSNRTTITSTVYQRISNKPFKTVIDDAIFAINQHNFRLISQSDISKALSERDNHPFPALTILSFCNLSYAKEVLETTGGIAAIYMPCRMIIRQVGKQVVIETLLLNDPLIQPELANKINQIMRSIADNAAT